MTKISSYSLKEIKSEKDIPYDLLNTPFEDLLNYHNLNASLKEYETAQMRA